MWCFAVLVKAGSERCATVGEIRMAGDSLKVHNLRRSSPTVCLARALKRVCKLARSCLFVLCSLNLAHSLSCSISKSTFERKQGVRVLWCERSAPGGNELRWKIER